MTLTTVSHIAHDVQSGVTRRGDRHETSNQLERCSVCERGLNRCARVTVYINLTGDACI